MDRAERIHRSLALEPLLMKFSVKILGLYVLYVIFFWLLERQLADRLLNQHKSIGQIFGSLDGLIELPYLLERK
jgi:hypothetical protein